jgi:large subunit ribosomal protein L24
MAGMNVRKGDKVRVISGKDRGLEGRVILTMPDAERVLVEGANRIKKHTKVTSSTRGAKQGGIVTQEAPLHVSNVQVICGSCGKPTRIGHRKEAVTKTRADGSTYDTERSVRVCKRCNADI